MEILKCENIRKVYGSGNNQVVALDHIDLSVQKGEFVAIVGAVSYTHLLNFRTYSFTYLSNLSKEMFARIGLIMPPCGVPE